MGRRSPDDQRQVDRWDNYAGEKRGRWLRNLVGKIHKANKSFDDVSVSPVIRQGLQHWGYLLTKKEFENIYSSKECSVQNFYQPHGGRIQKFSINDENGLLITIGQNNPIKINIPLYLISTE